MNLELDKYQHYSEKVEKSERYRQFTLYAMRTGCSAEPYKIGLLGSIPSHGTVR